MKTSLARWVAAAETLQHFDHFGIAQAELASARLQERADDYYISLVGTLFDYLRNPERASGWSTLGNAFAHFALPAGYRSLGRREFISRDEAVLYSATAFYYGGFPASAYLMMRQLNPEVDRDLYQACYEFLAKPIQRRSAVVAAMFDALENGDLGAIDQIAADAEGAAHAALSEGPNQWIPAQVFSRLARRFAAANVRAILPDGQSEFWTPLVASLLRRSPPSWDFFPSQAHAIHSGLLSSPESFALQMPTGAGKTTLCETLLYTHAKRHPDQAAVFVVPYRSLAGELRVGLVAHLGRLGISARCAYGGTVPTGAEARMLADTRVLVATPEALAGILSSDTDFFHRVSLVICDEGHLLDQGARGIGLELLLARFKARSTGAPRFVFVSAIVPNVEEISSWLGGGTGAVVRSDYRPAVAEFAVLRVGGSGVGRTAHLQFHPHTESSFTIESCLAKADFQYDNPLTGRRNTYAFGSVKTQAVALARKTMASGPTAIFAANKRGDQGAVGLAEELLEQLKYELPLPRPIAVADHGQLAPAVDYLRREYGDEWVGTRALAAGAVLHHGDVPQATREVLERLVRHRVVRLVICTTTLAEGVNLPITTLVLYSVRRRQRGGAAQALLLRDIKNLVGRAGRAGSSTKGLVICANAGDWAIVDGVARGYPGEDVQGALMDLLRRLGRGLALQGMPLDNSILDGLPDLHTLTDGVDATLIDLAAEEIGGEALHRLAMEIAEQTFAWQQADHDSRELLREVFALRSQKIQALQQSGRLNWIRQTGARPRTLDAVLEGLRPVRQVWHDVASPTDPEFVRQVLDWAWTQPEVTVAAQDAFRVSADDLESIRDQFYAAVQGWLAGNSFHQIATATGLDMNDLLRVYTHGITYALQTVVEQGIAVLAQALEADGQALAEAVRMFPEHLRFGVSEAPARRLAAGGLRHRRACVELGHRVAASTVSLESDTALLAAALSIVYGSRDDLVAILGVLVLEHSEADLRSEIARTPGGAG